MRIADIEHEMCKQEDSSSVASSMVTDAVLLALLQVVFIVLKLCGAAQWSWMLVLSLLVFLCSLAAMFITVLLVVLHLAKHVSE